MWLLWTPLSLAAPPGADLVAPLGVDRLAEIGELSFTFQVEAEGAQRPPRSWRWRPSDNHVERTTLSESGDPVLLAFTFGAPKTEEERKADAQFVNDSFWLLPQLHIRWAGPDLTVTDSGPVIDPFGSPARKVVMQYAPAGGGYTPGDAYDLFLDAEGRILSWSYRKGGAPEPTLTTSFASYVTVGPLSVATEHKTPDGSFRLTFSNLSATPGR